MKKHLMKLALMTVSLGWAVGATPSAHAEQMTLQDLLNGGTITAGNMIFTDFTAFSSTAVGGLAVDPSQVFVIPTIEGGKLGLTFQGNGQFTVGQNGSLNAKFEFKAHSRSGEFDKAYLQLTASAHEADSFAHIKGQLDNGLPGLSVRTKTPFDTATSDFGSPKDRIIIAIDINLLGGGDTEAGSSVDSFKFTVDPKEPPEPASLTLLGIGAAGLIGYRWRRNRRLAV
jgi:hypothetical protein